jgi:hypothetical protein
MIDGPAQHNLAGIDFVNYINNVPSAFSLGPRISACRITADSRDSPKAYVLGTNASVADKADTARAKAVMEYIMVKKWLAS